MFSGLNTRWKRTKSRKAMKTARGRIVILIDNPAVGNGLKAERQWRPAAKCCQIRISTVVGNGLKAERQWRHCANLKACSSRWIVGNGLKAERQWRQRDIRILVWGKYYDVGNGLKAERQWRHFFIQFLVHFNFFKSWKRTKSRKAMKT